MAIAQPIGPGICLSAAVMTSIPTSDIPSSNTVATAPKPRWWQLGPDLHQLGTGQAQAMVANETKEFATPTTDYRQELQTLACCHWP